MLISPNTKILEPKEGEKKEKEKSGNKAWQNNPEEACLVSA